MAGASVEIVGPVGGREVALGMALGASSHVDQVGFVGGNPGAEQIGECYENFDDIGRQVEAIAERNPDLVVIGPEAPLVEGLAARLRDKGLTVFGPDAYAAKLESSKSFAIGVAEKTGGAFPNTSVFSDYAEAVKHLTRRNPQDIVLKADGLAGGKGVVLPDDFNEAIETTQKMMSGEAFGDAGRTMLVADRFSGPEMSLFAVTDGKNVVELPPAQDYKRAKDGDRGLNTGGMGSYAPANNELMGISEPDLEAAKEEALEDMVNVIDYMHHSGVEYKGVLYGGFMLSRAHDFAPYLIEYNVRFGDPETQALMPLLVNSGVDVFELLNLASMDGYQLGGYRLPDIGGAAVAVCMASDGYPTSSSKGDVITGAYEDYGSNHHVVQAGTAMNEDGDLVTAGGRVLYSVGVHEDHGRAAARAYTPLTAGKISFPGQQYRSDIAAVR